MPTKAQTTAIDTIGRHVLAAMPKVFGSRLRETSSSNGPNGRVVRFEGRRLTLDVRLYAMRTDNISLEIAARPRSLLTRMARGVNGEGVGFANLVVSTLPLDASATDLLAAVASARHHIRENPTFDRALFGAQ